MAITKDRKKELLDKANDIFSSSQSVVFTSAKGLGANHTSEMRSAMNEAGVGYNVIKKTLIGKALDDANITGDRPEFEGELAVAYADDLIAPARLVQEFAKKHKDNIAIMGGVFDGEYMDKAAMTAIANIPDVPVLRGMFVNVINSPIQGMVIALNAIAEKKSA